MKKLITIILFTVLGALAVAYWLLSYLEKSKQQPISVASVESTSVEESSKVEESDDVDKKLSERFTPEEVENLKYNHQAAQAANQNVVFYGKCVDQDGNPVPYVRVTARLTKMRKSMVSVVVNESFKYYETLTTSSDENGRFSFFDEGSYLLLESIEREGYLDARGPSRGYRFGQVLYGSAMAGTHEPDPLKPVVFTLWKMGGGSAGIELNDRNGARADFGFSKSEMGNILYVDLSKRVTTSGPAGNTMEVTAHNDADSRWDPDLFKHVGEGSNTAWSYTLRIPEGGIVPTNDLFLFRPPESGYQESYTFEVPEGEEGWISQVEEQKFYFKTVDGNYGAFALNVRATASGGMGFRFKKLYFNRTGERNLEHFE